MTVPITEVFCEISPRGSCGFTEDEILEFIQKQLDIKIDGEQPSQRAHRIAKAMHRVKKERKADKT